MISNFYYRQFSMNIKIKITKLILVLLARALGSSGLTKLVLILYIFILISAESSLKLLASYFYTSYLIFCNLENVQLFYQKLNDK